MAEEPGNPALMAAMNDIAELSSEIILVLEGLKTPRSIGSMLRDLELAEKKSHELGNAWGRARQAVLDAPLK